MQSNYIPWKGYFDMLAQVDDFVLYDEVQYTRRDWRNRNQIKTPQGLHWLSVPLQSKGNYLERINQMVVADRSWAAKHWRSIVQSYGKLATFGVHAGWLESAFEEAGRLERLTEINELFLRAICRALGLRTRLHRSSAFPRMGEGKNERLIDLCSQLNANEYLSGPAARSYVDDSAFAARGIAVRWMTYEGFRPYVQPHGPFVHAVSIVDLLLCTGAEARAFALRERTLP